MNDSALARERVQAFAEKTAQLKAALGHVVVGQSEIIDGVLTCLLSDSHVLLEGVPGLGKTLLIRSLAQALALPFSRIQFTPDLMPADILGTTVLEEGVTPGALRSEFRKGPIFSSIVLADEINRATPKTQSALLEAMQEHRVTMAGTTYDLGSPYFVLATQNPLEMEGTYPLPEAQLDRFLLKLVVPFPSHEELHEILFRTTRDAVASIEPIWSRADVLSCQSTVRELPVARFVQEYAIRLLRATHPRLEGASPEVRRFVASGASPRGAQALVLGAKARALLSSRAAVSIDDIRAVALPALRHRLVLNFEGEAEGVVRDDLIRGLIESVPVPKEP
jgi:MoxR-like ATPase